MTRVFSGIQPTGQKHIGNYLGAIRHYVADQETLRGRVDLLRRRPALDDPAVRARRADGLDARHLRHAGGLGSRSGARDRVRAEPRARARRARLALQLHRHDGRARAHGRVQGEVRRPQVRVASGSSPTRCCRPRTSSSTSPIACRWARTSASIWSSRATSRSASTRATATALPAPAGRDPEDGGAYQRPSGAGAQDVDVVAARARTASC